MKLYTAQAVAREVGDETVLLVVDEDKLFYLTAVELDKVEVYEDVREDARLTYVHEHLDELPPIVVVDGTVVDGAHRVTAARAAGRQTLRAFAMIQEIIE